MMDAVRFGVIGLGNIGQYHAGMLAQGRFPEAVLSAVADVRGAFGRAWAAEHAPGVRVFEQAEDLIEAGVCDAVIVATPPTLHPPLAIRAFARGLHVLVEKPAGVTARDVLAMNSAAGTAGRVFGIQLPHRLNPAFQAARRWIDAGRLGELQRTQWTSTRWYRTQDYYDSGGWRGTWKGEGGGVLVNQCPHDLDIWTWLCGLPERLRAFCRFGRWHDIEVEDDVTAYLEYPNGATGVFHCSTGEFPGINRLEIVGDRGTLVISDDRHVEFLGLEESVREHCRTAKGFGVPAGHSPVREDSGEPADNADNVSNFLEAVLRGAPLVAPGVEGLRSVELSNAMQLSAWLGETVEVPVDPDRYAGMLEERIRRSRVRKPEVTRTLDITDSWR